MKPIFVIALSVSLFSANAQKADTLFQNFQIPPQAAKPRVWWHWMNGNVTTTGITHDLEWMKRVGIGGVQMFEASLATPRLMEKPVVYGNDEWKIAIKHTAKEIKRLGLEYTLAGSGGWSQSGGPMVKAEEAMKKVVWSETHSEGGQNQSLKLPLPPNTTGKFQDVPHNAQVPFYKDFAVVAYKTKQQDASIQSLKPLVTSSGGGIDLDLLNDNLYQNALQLNTEINTEKAWIQYEFDKPIAFQAVTMAILPNRVAFFALDATGQILGSNDGKTFTNLLNFPSDVHRPSPVRTYTLGGEAYRFYKIVFKPLKKYSFDLHANILTLFKNLPPIGFYKLSELKFHTTPQVNQWQDKAAFGLMFDYQNMPTNASNTEGVSPQDIFDLTDKMKPDGTLDINTTAFPAFGSKEDWTILRMGYSLTGHTNGPTYPELTGLEVDKLNKKHVQTYIEKYLNAYLDVMGDDKDALTHILLDSWEAELQNWTEDMLVSFEKRNGYSAKPYLPVLTGKIVGSGDISDRFLWDFRATISDLIAENHYQTIADYLHSKNIKLYGEAIGASLGTMGEGLTSKSKVDIPMGEFWTPKKDGKFDPVYEADILEAASAAHIYDKNIVAAESFTDDDFPFGPPSKLKPIADYYLSLGVNRFVIHTSVHQPFEDKKPGMTLIFIGQHYSRHNTWAEQSKVWNQYLGRCSYMLQQGQSVNDIAYFVGEDAPATANFWSNRTPSVPEGFKMDLVNSDVILNKMTVENGEIVLPNGLHYKMLVFPNTLKTMTLPLLNKIKTLVEQGALVYCPKPNGSPSLSDFGFGMSDFGQNTAAIRNPKSEIAFGGVLSEIPNLQSEIASLWGDCNGTTTTRNDFGKGSIYWGNSLENIFENKQILSDLIYTKPHFDTKLNWIHRRAKTSDIYFIANQKAQTEDVKIKCRVTGFKPELWDTETGKISDVNYEMSNDFTTISVILEANQSVFIVFREKTDIKSNASTPTVFESDFMKLDQNWTLNFPDLYQNTTEIKLNNLVSWTDLPDSTLNYFSGTATYSNTFTLKKIEKGASYILDLGDVRELAEVKLNGKDLGILWKKPFKVAITEGVKLGKNELEIKVINLWSNRMFGDTHLPTNKHYTFALNRNLDGSLPNSTVLLPSGLLGGVIIKMKK